MPTQPFSLATVYDGWDGYHLSIVHAIASLSPEQLAYRPAPHLRSIGEIASHISLGRIDWFQRMGAPGRVELAAQAESWEPEEAIVGNAAALVRRLEVSWQMVEKTLATWTVDDLAQTYRQSYQGQTYVVSRQWTTWRVMAHDIHHGGQIAIMLSELNVAIPELGDLGGHLTQPPLADF